VGKNVLRKEGAAKVTGEARYIDDLRFPGMIHGVTVRSDIPRGKLLGLRFEGDVPWNEITVVTAGDIPGENIVTMHEKDQPYLAQGEIHHSQEPVALLAHPDRDVLQRALRSVKLDVEPLPPVLTLDDSLARKHVIWGKDNVFKSFRLQKGDPSSIWLSAPRIVEGEYVTGAQEQLYIEPQGAIAVASPAEGVTVWGSLQCPYYVHKALKPLFGLAGDRVRVIQTETGGGFGGKEEYPSVIAGHAALLAWKSGRPVKMIYPRDEDMAATTKRHPSRTRIRSAVDEKGRLLALEIEFLLDGGAYCTLSPVVLSRGTIHASGPYRCDHVLVDSRALATNTPPHGAFRGFGAPQSLFAIERHMDRIARELGLSPEAVRRANLLRSGDTTATSQIIREKVDFPGLIATAARHSGLREKCRSFARSNRGGRFRKGIGLACVMHGAGFTGSGENNLKAVAGVEITPEGRVRVLSGSTEIGQGTNTIFAQIAADALGISYDDVDVAQPDTRSVPDSGPTVASRTCMIVGKLVESAANGIKDTLVRGGLLGKRYTRAQFKAACSRHAARAGSLRCLMSYEPPASVSWDDANYRGEAYATYAWAVYVAEVSVDMVTYRVSVDDFVAVQEVGKVIHPLLAAGQIEGGVAQGIGYALYENVVWKDGRMANNQMTNYIIPTSLDTPPIRVFFEEDNREHGPFGAKGIGELPMDAPAPAILSAVEMAIGVSFDKIPVLPEDVMHALEGRRGG